MIKFIVMYLLLIVISCGKGLEDKNDEDSEEETTPEGNYSAILIPVNAKISTQVSGVVNVSKFGDEFSVKLQLKNPPPGNLKQSLRLGSSCPRLNRDVNGDGYIDEEEAQSDIGKIIVPFDNDLSSQLGGSGLSFNGSYLYSQTTSFELMLSDLRQLDEDQTDSIIKLGSENLTLERRVVTISIGNRYSASVQGSEILVACAILVQTTDNGPPPDSEDPTPDDDRVRRRPPRYEPDPAPSPDRTPDDDRGDWWDGIGDTWRRWRDRVRDWWSNNRRRP